jgi:hypothetical protein
MNATRKYRKAMLQLARWQDSVNQGWITTMQAVSDPTYKPGKRLYTRQ